jgi:hypothetical protein
LPVILVQKKSGELCFHVDYRKVIDVTKKDCFPQLKISDTLDTLAIAKWFLTWTRDKSRKLQLSCEGPYKVIT